jgi:hypothetical protein
MRDGFACHLANFKNLATAGTEKGTRGDQSQALRGQELRLIRFVVAWVWRLSTCLEPRVD